MTTSDLRKNERERERERERSIYVITLENPQWTFYISDLGLIFSLRPQFGWWGEDERIYFAWIDLGLYRRLKGHQITGFCSRQ